MAFISQKIFKYRGRLPFDNPHALALMTTDTFQCRVRADGAEAAEREHEGASNPGTPVLEPRGLPSPVDVWEGGRITTPSGTPTPPLPEEQQELSLEEMLGELMDAEEASASEPAQQVFKR